MASNRYRGAVVGNVLPPLAEDERVYLCVDYRNRYFARCCHCGFDSERKLWFTGACNARIRSLVRLYGVHESTGERARELLRIALEPGGREELLRLLSDRSEKPCDSEGAGD